jgi:UPF0042 nucleotide-binding protein
MEKPLKHRVILVTGMSGAGRSFALKTLEDIGFETVDNLPLSLLNLVVGPEAALDHPIAIGVDVRTRDFSTQRFLTQIDRLQKREDVALEVVFCDCDDDILAQRYTETRRKHPLSLERPALDGILAERQILKEVLGAVTFTLDTTRLPVTETRQILKDRFALEGATQTYIHVVSFGFKKGIVRQADMIFDARFLKNPFYDETLRPHSGKDADVSAFIEQDPLTAPFLEHVKATVSLMLPRFDDESRSYFTLAFGCTGGQHRSVYCARVIHQWLQEQGRTRLGIHHRDVS